VHHARHDFIFADEDASAEVKKNLEQLHDKVREEHSSYSKLLL
jgi:hypothetical protein